MLVLTRKQNEKIRIGDSITITVLRMKGKAVRLGIEAPHEVNVVRGELCFDLSEEGVAAPAPADDEEAAGAVPPKSKSLSSSARTDVAGETTRHWPLPSREKNASMPGACTIATSSPPLGAMIDGRTP